VCVRACSPEQLDVCVVEFDPVVSDGPGAGLACDLTRLLHPGRVHSWRGEEGIGEMNCNIRPPDPHDLPTTFLQPMACATTEYNEQQFQSSVLSSSDHNQTPASCVVFLFMSSVKMNDDIMTSQQGVNGCCRPRGELEDSCPSLLNSRLLPVTTSGDGWYAGGKNQTGLRYPRVLGWLLQHRTGHSL